MSGTTEASARVKINALLKDAGWNLTDGSSVLFEHAFPDGTQADYMHYNRQGQPMVALEAKRVSINPVAAQDQGRHYAEQLGVVPFVFLSNGDEVRFPDREMGVHAPTIAGFFLDGGPLCTGYAATPLTPQSTGRSSTAASRSSASRRCPPSYRAGGASCWLRWRREPARPAWRWPSSKSCTRRASSRARGFPSTGLGRPASCVAETNAQSRNTHDF